MNNIKYIPFLLLSVIFFSFPAKTNAQFWNKLKKHVEKKVEKEAEKRTNKKTDEAVDEVFDTVEEGAEGAVKGDTDNSKDPKNKETEIENGKESNSEKQIVKEDGNNENDTQTPEIKWAKFDFIPGDEVIFEDEPSSDEENGEFPSRWDLKRGNVEIAEMDDKNVIMFLSSAAIVPYLKNPKEDYLPDVFTVEFDAYFTPKTYSGRYFVYLFDRKNQKRGDNKSYLTINVNKMNMDESSMTYPDKKKGNWDETDGWRHVSIAFTKGKFKAYLDDTRLINIPHYGGNPTGITIEAEKHKDYQKFIKNIRIAKGGVKYYDRFMTDGKIIVNGIRFDVNKATIKPESNGAINKIFKLMKKYPDIKFSVEGHTDSDGDEQHNLQLSEKRAKAVMDRLISLGISADRLEYKGFGESKPLDNNSSAEGKANNRRVEFVKI